MAYNRYLKREKFKRQYTFTRTKAVVGFVLSVICSVSLSAYFDRYGGVIVDHFRDLFSQSASNLELPKLQLRSDIRSDSRPRVRPATN